jgi:hypothetical protein
MYACAVHDAAVSTAFCHNKINAMQRGSGVGASTSKILCLALVVGSPRVPFLGVAPGARLSSFMGLPLDVFISAFSLQYECTCEYPFPTTCAKIVMITACHKRNVRMHERALVTMKNCTRHCFSLYLPHGCRIWPCAR